MESECQLDLKVFAKMDDVSIPPPQKSKLRASVSDRRNCPSEFGHLSVSDLFPSSGVVPKVQTEDI